MKFNTTLKFVLTIAAIFMLASCGSAPKIHSAHRTSVDIQKVSNLQFVYRKSDLRQVSAIKHGTVKRQDHGYAKFGELLASRAAAVFEKYSVKVVDAREIDVHDKIEPSSEIGNSAPALIIYAVKGDNFAHLNNSRTNYVFEARLIDITANRIIWRALIETSTWSGDDFVLGNVKKTTYDEAYADQMLNTLAEKMKSDHVI